MSGRGEVVVWTMEVDAPPPTTMAGWRSCLGAAELDQADRFHFEVDRIAYTAAHWLVRHALAATGGLPPAHWRFVNEDKGKPQIDPVLDRPRLQFSLSHSGGLVACAVTTDSAIGIDVEATSPHRAGLDVAKHHFAPDEVAFLRAAPPNDQREIFIRFWTLKEAFIKATGEGLSRPLDSFSFSLDPTSVTFHPDDPAEAASWTFAERRPTANHALAIAVRESSIQSLRLVSLSRDAAAVPDDAGRSPAT
jgi:4'-phosphopantetheinyl transferase